MRSVPRVFYFVLFASETQRLGGNGRDEVWRFDNGWWKKKKLAQFE